MTYSVKYKRVFSLFWKTLEKVKADGILVDSSNGVKSVLPYRWFILEDESRVEIPMEGIVFNFSQSRYLSIKKNMESEIGQPVITK